MSSETQQVDNFVIRYFRDFGVLRETRREYWGLQAINVLDSVAYFAMLNIAVVCFSEDFGFSDEHAGYLFTLFSSVTTLLLFGSGLFTDWLGIKKASVISMVGQAVTCLGIVFAGFMAPGGIRDGVITASLFLMAPFAAMVQTLFQSGNKRFTTKKSRGAGFNLWYLFMNVGAAAGGFLELGLPRVHVFTLGVVLRLLCVALTFLTIHNTRQLYGPDEQEEEARAAAKAEENDGKKPLAIMLSVLSDRISACARSSFICPCCTPSSGSGSSATTPASARSRRSIQCS